MINRIYRTITILLTAAIFSAPLYLSAMEVDNKYAAAASHDTEQQPVSPLARRIKNRFIQEQQERARRGAEQLATEQTDYVPHGSNTTTIVTTQANDHDEEIKNPNMGENTEQKIKESIRTGICSFCTKRYSGSGNMKRHIRMHTGEKPFYCPHCNKYFADVCNRKRHIISKHLLGKYQCHYCPAFFSDPNNCKRHEKNIHSDTRTAATSTPAQT